MKWRFLWASVMLLLFISQEAATKGLREEFTWTRISYDLNSRAGRSARYGFGPHMQPPSSGSHQHNHAVAISFPSDDEDVPQTSSITQTSSQSSGSNYIYENNVPMGVNRWKNKLFVSVPRRRPGVPSTLNFVWINDTQRHNVPLIPYPDLETNTLPARYSSTREGSSRAVNFASVYRVFVDSCDRLWVADNGLLEFPGNRTRVEHPSLVLIDLNTNRILNKYVFKDSDVRPDTTLASVTVDEGATCQDAYAYLPDLSGYGMIVYSLKDNDSWRVTHNYFYLEPHAGEFMIGGHTFQWNDGVFSAALTQPDRSGHKTLYFHSMAGTHIYSVGTQVLRNSQLSTRSYHGRDFRIELDRGTLSQTSSTDLHKNTGIMFLGLVNQNALGCWNTRKGSRIENFDVVQRDDQKMIYPCDVKIYQDEVIVLTNNMPIFLYGRLDYNQINFRVWMANVNDAVRDTACSENVFRPGATASLGTTQQHNSNGGFYGQSYNQ